MMKDIGANEPCFDPKINALQQCVNHYQDLAFELN